MFIVLRATKNTIGSSRPQFLVVAGSGVLDSIANALYLLAVRHGLMTLVATINSFYPASTLLLATGLDGEKIHRPQMVGLALACVALVMITVS
jgi:uncharacterized membrane protein